MSKNSCTENFTWMKKAFSFELMKIFILGLVMLKGVMIFQDLE
jgi:hypothetical protein